jgi:hypothetical protein
MLRLALVLLFVATVVGPWLQSAKAVLFVPQGRFGFVLFWSWLPVWFERPCAFTSILLQGSSVITVDGPEFLAFAPATGASHSLVLLINSPLVTGATTPSGTPFNHVASTPYQTVFSLVPFLDSTWPSLLQRAAGFIELSFPGPTTTAFGLEVYLLEFVQLATNMVVTQTGVGVGAAPGEPDRRAAHRAITALGPAWTTGSSSDSDVAMVYVQAAAGGAACGYVGSSWFASSWYNHTSHQHPECPQSLGSQQRLCSSV